MYTTLHVLSSAVQTRWCTRWGRRWGGTLPDGKILDRLPRPSLDPSVAPGSAGKVHRYLRPRLTQDFDHIEPLLAAPSVVACEDERCHAVWRMRLVVCTVMQQLLDDRLMTLGRSNVLSLSGGEGGAGGTGVCV